MARLIGNQLIDSLEDLRSELDNLITINAELASDEKMMGKTVG
jgi:hypothetical protein